MATYDAQAYHTEYNRWQWDVKHHGLCVKLHFCHLYMKINIWQRFWIIMRPILLKICVSLDAIYYYNKGTVSKTCFLALYTLGWRRGNELYLMTWLKNTKKVPLTFYKDSVRLFLYFGCWWKISLTVVLFGCFIIRTLLLPFSHQHTPEH